MPTTFSHLSHVVSESVKNFLPLIYQVLSIACLFSLLLSFKTFRACSKCCQVYLATPWLNFVKHGIVRCSGLLKKLSLVYFGHKFSFRHVSLKVTNQFKFMIFDLNFFYLSIFFFKSWGVNELYKIHNFCSVGLFSLL